MADKTRFSARVKTDTLDTIDDHSDETGLNRSATIDQIVEEWQQAGTDDAPADAYATLSAVGGTLWASFVALTMLFGVSLAATAALGVAFAGTAATVLQMMGLLLALLVGVTVERGRRLVRDYDIRNRDVLRLYFSAWLGLPRPDVDVPEEVVPA